MSRLLARTLAVVSVLLLSDQTKYYASAQATPPPSRGLHSLFVASGKLYFGNAMDVNVFNDTAYQAIASNKNEFGMIVPENSQKWGPIEPTQGNFKFSNTDAIAGRAKTNGQKFRCHALTWHSQLPEFIETNTWTRTNLTLAIQTHITTLLTHYKSQCYSWDVVNEALNENGTFRSSVFFRVLGTDFLPISFAAAAAADPSAKLYYNDFNLETNTLKADSAAHIVSLIRNSSDKFPGARIDGLGFQAHLRVGQTPPQANLTRTLARFADMGLDVALSELDIAHTALPADGGALAQQASDYVSVVGACLAVLRCVGITVWQFTDKYSWIPATFPGMGDACLFTADFKRKPAYVAVENLLVAVAESVKAVSWGNETSAVLNLGGAAVGLPGVGGGSSTSGVGSVNDDAATAALTSGGSSVVWAFAGHRDVFYWALSVIGVFVVL